MKPVFASSIDFDETSLQGADVLQTPDRIEFGVNSIADWLLEALWREGLWLVNDGIAVTEEIDDAIRFGAGIRWSMMGTFLIYRLAGGLAGLTKTAGRRGAFGRDRQSQKGRDSVPA